MGFYRSPFIRVALFYFSLLTALFFPVLFGHRTLMASASDAASILPEGAYKSPVARSFGRLRDPGAPAWQFEPGLAVTHRILFQEHNLPWWNPYQGLGTPWAAGMIAQPFYPLTVLAAVHPAPRVIAWFVVARLFIAGLLAYGFLRLFLSVMPSCLGGLVFMLTGYFVINMNLDNLSTDILAPLILLSFEKLFRSSASKWWFLAILSVWLVLISGMPESAFIILMFGYAYFTFRVVTFPETRQRAAGLMGRLFICNVLAFALSAFLTLPMLEFLGNGYDVHRTSPYGLLKAAVLRDVLLYLLPLAAGPLYSARYLGLGVKTYGYFGVSCSALTLTAILTLFRREARDQAKLMVFFTSVLAICIAKYLGLPPLQSIGSLPLFKLVNFPQYLQPTMALCVAVLCAYASDQSLRRVVKEEMTLAVLALCSFAAILAVRFALFMGKGDPQEHFFSYSLVLGTLIAGALLVIGALGSRGARPQIIFVALSAVVAAELSFNYIYPIYFDVQRPPEITANPYEGAPYLNFLKQQEIGYSRVFGRQLELYPGWAAAFQMFDSRLQTAIYPVRLFPFGRAFFDVDKSAATGELADRFTGAGFEYSFGTEREQRFLQLSSTRFIVSPSLLASDWSSKLIQAALQQNSALAREQALVFNLTRFSIDNDTRPVLFEHPPRSRLSVRVHVPEVNAVLQFSPAMNPALFGSNCGDGVNFTLEESGSDGKITPLYHRYIDPKHNPLQRHWFNEKVDLSRLAGRDVTLLLSTDGGPAGNTSCDWAGWAGLSFASSSEQDKPNLKLVYDAEAKVYEFSHPLPRAALFQQVTLVNDEKDALLRVTDPSVEVAREVVVVVNKKLPQTESELLAKTRRATPKLATAARIVDFSSQLVRIRSNFDHAGMLMLTDTFFPGWNVYVDNERRTLLQADYMFRGVLVEEGPHIVEFRYEGSAARMGGLVSLGGAFTAVALWYARKRQRRVSI